LEFPVKIIGNLFLVHPGIGFGNGVRNWAVLCCVIAFSTVSFPASKAITLSRNSNDRKVNALRKILLQSTLLTKCIPAFFGEEDPGVRRPKNCRYFHTGSFTPLSTRR
jgi:hypothetical protein